MDKYSKHFLLNVDTAKEYAKEKVEYFKDDETLDAVSYTHLDVYKRQVLNSSRFMMCRKERSSIQRL